MTWNHFLFFPDGFMAPGFPFLAAAFFLGGGGGAPPILIISTSSGVKGNLPDGNNEGFTTKQNLPRIPDGGIVPGGKDGFLGPEIFALVLADATLTALDSFELVDFAADLGSARAGFDETLPFLLP